MGENRDALLRLKFGFSRATFSHSSLETQAGGQPGPPEKPVPFPVCRVGKEAAAGLEILQPGREAHAETQQELFIPRLCGHPH